MGLHKVEIKTDENGLNTIKVDGHRLHGIHNVTARFEKACYPLVEIELYDINEIDTSAYVEFAFSPETVQKACSVIRAACLEDEAFAKTVKASIRAALQSNKDIKDTDGIAETIFQMVFIGR